MNRNTNPLKNDLYQVGITMSLCGISLPDRSVLQYFIEYPPKMTTCQCSQNIW